MKTLSKELVEAALVDGASVWTIYRKIILPLCRPALAALAVLEFTFIYNDFFWALFLMKTGAKRPVTSGLNDLQGAFFTDNNQLAAAALLVAMPDDRRLPGALEAVRPRPHPGVREGLTRRPAGGRSAADAVAGLVMGLRLGLRPGSSTIGLPWDIAAGIPRHPP